ncbi:PKD domain-containing protein [Chloroflexota bacterium]
MEYWNESSTTKRVIIIAAVAIIACACLAACAGLAVILLGDRGEEATATPGATIPILTGSPAPTVVVSGWVGEYYDNKDLQGEPVLVRDDPTIDFDWGDGSPAPDVPADNFSVRWTTSRDLEAGTYRFTIAVDDGVRMWVDDNLLIDSWTDGAKTVSADMNLIRGTHSAVVEYYEGTGSAQINLEAAYIDEYPDWKSEYFDNPEVSGAPVVVRNEVVIDHNWGTGSPAPGVPSDNYSVRWTNTSPVAAGEYFIIAYGEGGIRVWLDERLLIDDWQSSGLRTLTAETGPLSEGDHSARVEYFKQTGNGSITVGWSLKQEAGPPTAVINGPTQATVGQAVKFSGRNSGVAPGSVIVSYVWSFGDGSETKGVNVAHIYDTAGTYDVTLQVTDDQGLSGTAIQQIQVSPAPTPPPESIPPEAVIAAPNEGKVGEQIKFDGSQSKSATPLLAYLWDFGDGTSANATITNKVYHASGTYYVILTVIDSQGLEDSSTTSITIYEDQVTPTPQPTNTTEATEPPEPTPTEETGPTNTPEPEATNTPEPEPTDTSEPGPTDTSEPEPTDTSEPEPTDTSEPEPTDTEEPEATDTPTPTPTPTPEPTASS